MMVSDWLSFVGRVMHVGVMTFVIMVAVCTLIGWLALRIVRSFDSDLLVGVIFIIAAGIALETWQTENLFEWIFVIPAVAMIGADLYRRLINGR
jgi:hypothetical protein